MCMFVIPFTIITVNFTINTITSETGLKGGCWTGILPLGTIPIVSFDIAFSSYMCLCFIVPLLSIKLDEFASPAVAAEHRDLRRLCERTAVITTVSLFATGINLFTLVWFSQPFIDNNALNVKLGWMGTHGATVLCIFLSIGRFCHFHCY
ncbi:hypothetical protein BC830DRAFT_179155 [Chytriomyces sp. MP71]|nr:hypothetical protein BC830DRAFT_179155 [Chytriomyces sp. MP71]